MAWQHCVCVTDCYSATVVFPVSACSTICILFPQDQTFQNIQGLLLTQWRKNWPCKCSLLRKALSVKYLDLLWYRGDTRTHKEENLCWTDKLMKCPLLRWIFPFLQGRKDPHISAAPFFLFLPPTSKQELIYPIHNKRQHNNRKIYPFDPVLPITLTQHTPTTNFSHALLQYECTSHLRNSCSDHIKCLPV